MHRISRGSPTVKQTISRSIMDDAQDIEPLERTNEVQKDPEVTRSFIEFVRTVGTALFADDNCSFDRFLGKSDNINGSVYEKCHQFTNDSNPMVLFVLKQDSMNEIEENKENLPPSNNDKSTNRFSYRIDTRLSHTSDTVATIAIIKRPSPLTSSYSIADQVQAVTLPSFIYLQTSNPYEVLHSMMHFAVAPYFDAYCQPKSADEISLPSSSIEGAIPTTRKKINELETSFLHLQQDFDIPEIVLHSHPVIETALKGLSNGESPTSALVPQHYLSDVSFINSLQSVVNGWIKSIQAITRMTRDPTSGTASQEINFWLSLETALLNTQNQLDSPAVILTLDVLKNAKRFHATVSFLSDTGLKEAIEQVQRYNQLMRDFPLEELKSAASLEMAQTAVNDIFAHFNKRLKSVPYPIWRALALVENISKDLHTTMYTILNSKRLLHISYPEFMTVSDNAMEVFSTWDENVKEFVNVAREMTRKRSEKFIPIRFVAYHQPIKERLQYIQAFRQRHEELRKTISKALVSANRSNDGLKLTNDYSNPLKEIEDAYNSISEIAVFDLSESGISAWNRAETIYADRTTGVEQAIISMIRERLAIARNANEMFRVFSTFNALFIRPAIRGAIQEHQTHLIEKVHQDINELQNRFRQKYTNSEGYEMAKIHDIPPISATIIWMKQVEYQLDTYLERVKDILGEDWQKYAEGQRLYEESLTFRAKLNPLSIFDNWIMTLGKRNISIDGYLFRIRKQKSTFSLIVNFDPGVASLFKEVRILQSLGFQIPHHITSTSRSAKSIYHFAVSLIDGLTIFNNSMEIMAEKTGFGDNLIYKSYNQVLELIKKGTFLKWESFAYAHMGPYEISENSHVKFLQELQRSIIEYQTDCEKVSTIMMKINLEMEKLANNNIVESSNLRLIISNIQEFVDNLNLDSLSNINEFVERINEQIGGIIEMRCRKIIRSWISIVKTRSFGDNYIKLPVPPVIRYHELSLNGKSITLKPELSSSKSILYYNIQQNLLRFLGLDRIEDHRYDIATKKKDFMDLISSIGPELIHALITIDDLLVETNKYLEIWYQFQGLWDIEIDKIYQMIGSDINKWLNLLNEVQSSHNTFDTNDSYKMCGIMKIDFKPIRTRINSKYDIWQHDLIMKFSDILNLQMKDTCFEIETSRNELEMNPLNLSSTEAVIKCITTIQQCSSKLEDWEKSISLYRLGQQILSRNRFQFPVKWLFIDQLENEWTSLLEILNRRKQSTEGQSDSIRSKIDSEITRLSEMSNTLEETWQMEKPISGSIQPGNALKLLQKFSLEVENIIQLAESVKKASIAISLEFEIPSNLSLIQEEIQDLNSVWTSLDIIWNRLNDLKELSWLTITPRKIRQELDELSQLLRSLPSRIRQYSAYHHIQTILKNLIGSNPLISELKSDFIRERHWQMLFNKLSPKHEMIYNRLKLGDIWDLNVQLNVQVINDIISIAKGELVLENFFIQLRETWSNYFLELINYKNVCHLIKGWDDLLQKCSDHLNSLSAMHHSPYFKVFEDEAQLWESRLGKMNSLFDIWLDVQRRWVYLEGVFNSSNDIKLILPLESTRFQSANSEFMLILKTVYKSPLVLDVLGIPEIQNSIERMAGLLTRVEKALGEYFEKERQKFGRFYFIGDEDLLEIIGNPSDLSRAQVHLPKMFSGIAGIINDESKIYGVRSKEGEELIFEKAIVLDEKISMSKWLKLLERSSQEGVLYWFEMARKELDGIEGRLDEVNGGLDVPKQINSIPEATKDISEDNKKDIDDASATVDPDTDDTSSTNFLSWITNHPAQALILSYQTKWTSDIEKSLKMQSSSLENRLMILQSHLQLLSSISLLSTNNLVRLKCQSLITELIHLETITNLLIKNQVSSVTDFIWLKQLRYYFVPEASPLNRIEIKQANASFKYGFEYLGIPTKLVMTPVVNDLFLVMTQALNQNLGGSPFGPAGTGKTESIKALGQLLGRFVIVFCCDEYFDYQSIGRILVGICKIGAWGCFDEFNRLTDNILSAVASQLETIGVGMNGQEEEKTIELIGRKVSLHNHTGVFVTMNPRYAGRNKLPDNLRRLLREFSLNKPDKEIITEVILYSQGFKHAKALAGKIVPFFELLEEQLSKQSHYDFGLRALKSVLAISGNMRRDLSRSRGVDGRNGKIETPRDKIGESEGPDGATESSEAFKTEVERHIEISKDGLEGSKDRTESSENPEGTVEGHTDGPNDSFDHPDHAEISSQLFESRLILRAINESTIPKLIPQDLTKMTEIQSQIFPNISYTSTDIEQLRHSIIESAKSLGYVPYAAWVEKILHLSRFLTMHQGIMLVGKTSTGKTSAYRTLIEALKTQNIDSVVYCVDAKVLSKKALYGSFDLTTREWVDGMFTQTLRKISENLRGEQQKHHWIVFDGDVDPEWIENLNSVLDDNRLFTLPSGERIPLPNSVSLIFEVDNLKNTTPATITRCGMIWFGDDTINSEMIFEHNLWNIERQTIIDESELFGNGNSEKINEFQCHLFNRIRYLLDSKTMSLIINESMKYDHLMEFNPIQGIESFFSLIKSFFRQSIDQLMTHPLKSDILTTIIDKKTIICLIWSFIGDSNSISRHSFGEFLQNLPCFVNLSSNIDIIDHEVSLLTGDWTPILSQIKSISLEPHQIVKSDIVIPTIDTFKHESLIYSYLSQSKPIILCGPPGSGKTMTLFSSLRKLNDLDIVGLNFSKETSPKLLIKSLEQHCQYRRFNNKCILSPAQIGRRLVVFCDEINLPALDKYGSQPVIDLLRQMIEHGGFWNEKSTMWIQLQNIQFVGACNPPTDVGRNALSSRFLRHCAVVLVDYPGEISLHQIYKTYNVALLKCVPSLRGYGDDITNAMIKVYVESQRKFTTKIHSHYIYSPRELTRWCRGLYEAIHPIEFMEINDLVRIWAHEALRLFSDRLVDIKDRQWTKDLIWSTAKESFPGCDVEIALKAPILYSQWLSRQYKPVQSDELYKFVTARMQTFREEAVDTPLILHDELLDSVLRIDRVLRQPQGHLILVGPSSSGRTTLTKFVCWMNGIKIFQLQTFRGYGYEDFAVDIRNLLKRTGCNGEKICFILDESNILESSFLECMNTILANGEVPGLFEGDDYTMLMTSCREGALKQGLNLNAEDELYQWFTSQIIRNLHVVFTLGPDIAKISSTATASPALFNRCVLNWMGDWSPLSLFQVGSAITEAIDLNRSEYVVPSSLVGISTLPRLLTFKDAVMNFVVKTHLIVSEFVRDFKLTMTPGFYLHFINMFVKLYMEKRQQIENRQRHFNVGLIKVKDATIRIRDLNRKLDQKRKELNETGQKANEMLRQMLADQNEAERKKVASIGIQRDLDLKEKEINARQQIVFEDLAKAEPAVLEAQKSVNNIKKQHLTELRSMAHPPDLVKMTLESVCVLLGYDVSTWRDVQQVIRKEDFIPSIVNFESESVISMELRNYMKNHYFSVPNFTYDNVNRASRACGPLLQWVEAQLAYSIILDKVGPLREEVDELEKEAEKTRARAEVIEEMIQELERSIDTYTEEYAKLITQTQSIKTEMQEVETRVQRSETLLTKLSEEKTRWTQSIKRFEQTNRCLPGNCLLASAFVSYGGYFDQKTRSQLLVDWLQLMDEANIEHDNESELSNYLSSVSERVSWHENSLPTDNISIENATILKQCIQYPFIIDPSGQSIEFLTKKLGDKLMITSFLDSSLVKSLESALRFGNPILIQDAEYLDPIITSIINGEYSKTGGRILINVGKQQIDFSPNFKLFLLTKDANVRVPSHVLSRITIINFTMTRNNLEMQALDYVLNAERPEIEKQRHELVKLQAEYKSHLYQLEMDLLKELNDTEGNILENDSLIETLEKIKIETDEVNDKMAQADIVMSTIQEILETYKPLTLNCSKSFLAIEKLRLLNDSYQFSLEFLLTIFNKVLKQANGSENRVEYLIKTLYVEIFRNIRPSLVEKHVPILALTLMSIYCDLSDDLLNRLMDPETILEEMKRIVPEIDLKVLKEQVENDTLVLRGTRSLTLRGTHTLELETDGLVKTQEGHILLESQGADILLSQGGNNSSEKTDTLESHNIDALKSQKTLAPQLKPTQLITLLAFIRHEQPHKFLNYMNIISQELFGTSLMYNEISLETIITETKPNIPVILFAASGHDPTTRINMILEGERVTEEKAITDDVGGVDEVGSDKASSLLAKTPRLITLAMGSKESQQQAEKLLHDGIKQGFWLLLQNIHMAIDWLEILEKRLKNGTFHADFRLLFTADIDSHINSTLVRLCRVVTLEKPPGIKSSMKTSFQALSSSRLKAFPLEKPRLYFMFSWIHSILKERLRFVPLGLSKIYVFDDSDYECGLHIIDQWISCSKSNISPENIPWIALKKLISLVVYQGKMDDINDKKVVGNIIQDLMVQDMFEIGFKLAGKVGPISPENGDVDSLIEWINQLPERESPTWLGLAEDSEKEMLSLQAGETVEGSLRLMRELEDE